MSLDIVSIEPAPTVVWKRRRPALRAHAWINGDSRCSHVLNETPRVRPSGDGGPPPWVEVEISPFGRPWGPMCAYCIQAVRSGTWERSKVPRTPAPPASPRIEKMRATIAAWTPERRAQHGRRISEGRRRAAGGRT